MIELLHLSTAPSEYTVLYLHYWVFFRGQFVPLVDLILRIQLTRTVQSIKLLEQIISPSLLRSFLIKNLSLNEVIKDLTWGWAIWQKYQLFFLKENHDFINSFILILLLFKAKHLSATRQSEFY